MVVPGGIRILLQSHLYCKVIHYITCGMQVQINILDPAVLIEARDNPDKYPGLLVRVSGYSAYFNDLSPAMKDEIISRSTH